MTGSGEGTRLLVLRVFLSVTCAVLLFWWPLSHWFYSDWYHLALGFVPGSYQQNMVRVIGTTGIIPVFLLFFSAIDPVKNRHMILTLIIFSILMAGTYLYLIFTRQFPEPEIINAGFSLFSALFLVLFFPRKYRHAKKIGEERKTFP